MNLLKLLCILRITNVIFIVYFSKGVPFPHKIVYTTHTKELSLFHNGGEPHYTSSLSGRVLVLNQSYEPISVCNVKKAVTLLFLMKAEIVVANDSRLLRSVSHSLTCPSVIRLRRYIHMPIKKVELSRKNILRRDGHRCVYCNTTKLPLTVDHVIPRSRNGGDTWENLVCACVKCNVRKGNRTPDEAGMNLATTPRRPSHVTFIKNLGGDLDDGWKPYLFM